MYEEITAQAEKVTEEIIGVSGIKKGQILVVGCSTSEICGDKIGTNSNLDVAKAAFKGIYEAACRKGIYVATQCCEHLNRAIIVEREAVPFAEIVNVVPQPKAGGSLSTTAYETFRDPVAVEEIKADAGIDIGGTLIGMHLKKVAVPVRLVNNHIGQAYVSAARTRPKFIGGLFLGFDSLKNHVVVYNLATKSLEIMSLLKYVVIITICYLPQILLLVTLAFAVSTIIGNTAFAIAITFAGSIGASLINMFAIVYKVKILKYFVTTNWDFTLYLFGKTSQYGTSLTHAIIVCLIYFLIMVVISFIVFKRKNIKNI